MKTIKGSWCTLFECAKCEERLGRDQMMYNMGTCPHCGNSEGLTIVRTKRVVAKPVYKPNWYSFFYWALGDPGGVIYYELEDGTQYNKKIK